MHAGKVSCEEFLSEIHFYNFFTRSKIWMEEDHDQMKQHSGERTMHFQSVQQLDNIIGVTLKMKENGTLVWKGWAKRLLGFEDSLMEMSEAKRK